MTVHRIIGFEAFVSLAHAFFFLKESMNSLIVPNVSVKEP